MKPKDEVRTRTVHCRVTDDEKRNIKRLTKKAGLTESEYCRKVLIEDQKRAEELKAELNRRKKIVAEMREHVNSHYPDVKDDEEIQQLFDECLNI